MEIRELYFSEHQTYKTFLMEGLINDENNFRISPDDEMKADFPTNGKADSFTLGAFVDGNLAGVVSFQREGIDRVKLRHKRAFVQDVCFSNLSRKRNCERIDG